MAITAMVVDLWMLNLKVEQYLQHLVWKVVVYQDGESLVVGIYAHSEASHGHVGISMIWDRDSSQTNCLDSPSIFMYMALSTPNET